MIPGLTIIEDFLSEDEEKELISFINTQEWNSTISRRVQHYGYEYGYFPPYEVKLTKPIPEIFMKYIRIINPEFNQVIVNEYEPGQGIGKHTDHKTHFGDMIVSISLLSATTITFSDRKYTEDIYVQPRTQVIMEGDARWKFTHQIPARKSDKIGEETIPRGKRISVTFRTYVGKK
jgi:alkylated DNA repair dioxygenase AlkB